MHSASLFYRIGRGETWIYRRFRHYKDADFHWEDGPKRPCPCLESGGCLFQKYSQEPVGIINAQISTGKAYKDADSKGSVSMDFGASYHRQHGYSG